MNDKEVRDLVDLLRGFSTEELIAAKEIVSQVLEERKQDMQQKVDLYVVDTCDKQESTIP